jgi:hypothetical protein
MSTDTAVSPVMKGTNCKGATVWDLYKADPYRSRRFNVAMKGIQQFQPENAILHGGCMFGLDV